MSTRIAPAEHEPQPSRLKVMRIHVEPQQVWFHCPRCDVALAGYYADPRGQAEVVCESCGAEFDIPSNAALVRV